MFCLAPVTSFLLSQVVLPGISDPTCHCFIAFQVKFLPSRVLWVVESAQETAAGQTCSGGWLDVGVEAHSPAWFAVVVLEELRSHGYEIPQLHAEVPSSRGSKGCASSAGKDRAGFTSWI